MGSEGSVSLVREEQGGEEEEEEENDPKLQLKVSDPMFHTFDLKAAIEDPSSSVVQRA